VLDNSIAQHQTAPGDRLANLPSEWSTKKIGQQHILVKRSPVLLAGMDLEVAAERPLLFPGTQEKLDAIKVTYVPARYMDLSKQMLDFIQRTVGLQDALVANSCSVYTMNQYCVKDRKFGVAIYEDEILAKTLRHLKGTDARLLYSAKQEGVTPQEATRNWFGTSLLRMISLAFDDRLELIKAKLCFLKIIFDYMKENEELFAIHKIELMFHVLRLEDEMKAFSLQLPTNPPEAGSFGIQSDMLRYLEHIHEEFMLDKVDVAIENLKGKAPADSEGGTTVMGCATGMDFSTGLDYTTGTDAGRDMVSEDAPSTPKRANQASGTSLGSEVSKEIAPTWNTAPPRAEKSFKWRAFSHSRTPLILTAPTLDG
jgi:hypothetical protein